MYSVDLFQMELFRYIDVLSLVDVAPVVSYFGCLSSP
jgi:hypothetical protein